MRKMFTSAGITDCICRTSVKSPSRIALLVAAIADEKQFSIVP
jgi:hypothetical protein